MCVTLKYSKKCARQQWRHACLATHNPITRQLYIRPSLYLPTVTATGPDYRGGGGVGRPSSDRTSAGCPDLSGGSVLGAFCNDLPELQKDAGQVRQGPCGVCFWQNAQKHEMGLVRFFSCVFFDRSPNCGVMAIYPFVEPAFAEENGACRPLHQRQPSVASKHRSTLVAPALAQWGLLE